MHTLADLSIDRVVLLHLGLFAVQVVLAYVKVTMEDRLGLILLQHVEYLTLYVSDLAARARQISKLVRRDTDAVAAQHRRNRARMARRVP